MPLEETAVETMTLIQSMTPLQTIITSLITSGIMFVIGFIVVNVWYHKRKEKRNAQIFVFTQILSAQAFMDYAKVKALNSIEIVFSGRDDIINAWRAYKKTLKIEGDKPTEQEIEAVKKTEKLLLEKMAKYLGYKNITWDTVDDPYYPNWIAEDEESRRSLNQFARSANKLMESQVPVQAINRQVYSPQKGKGKKKG